MNGLVEIWSIIKIISCFIVGIYLHSSFYAAIIGGFVGGLCTLIGVLISVNSAKNDIRLQIKAEEKNTRLQYRRDLLDEIKELLVCYEQCQLDHLIVCLQVNRTICGDNYPADNNRNPMSINNSSTGDHYTVYEKEKRTFEIENQYYLKLRSKLLCVDEAKKLLAKISSVYSEERTIPEKAKNIIMSGSDENPMNFICNWNKIKCEEIEEELEIFVDKYLNYTPESG